MLRIRDLTKRYGEHTVFDRLNLHLEQGETAFLQGRSGSGKSTLLKLLYRELADYTGEIRLGGQSIRELPKHETRRRVGVIFQSFELLERKTILENVMLAGEIAGRSRRELEPEACRLLERTGLRGREQAYPGELSGGEQQRTAIARALLNRPGLLLADEPTGNLDTETALEMLQLLTSLQQEEGMTMLIVTHSERLTEACPARMLRMEQGRILES